MIEGEYKIRPYDITMDLSVLKEQAAFLPIRGDGACAPAKALVLFQFLKYRFGGEEVPGVPSAARWAE